MTDDLQTFATEWADILESHIQKRMVELGVPVDLIGMPDSHGERRAFNPNDSRGGGVNSLGIEVDAGILNSALLVDLQTGKPLQTWKEARLRHRIDAVIVHELTEYRFMALQSSHDLALEFAPQMPGILPKVLAILEEMREKLRGN
jgi:hypothetical protein